MQFLYSVSGVIVSSPVALSTLTPAPSEATPDVEFALLAQPFPHDVRDWFLVRTEQGAEQVFMSTARVAGGYLIQLAQRYRFWVSRDGKKIVAYDEGHPVDTIEQLLLDQVLPQALHLRGQCTLHASAVALDGSVTAFVGRSGEGKSTLACALVPPGTLLSDDCLALRREGTGLVALPSYPSVRLRGDSAQQVGRYGALPAASSRMHWKQRLQLPAAERGMPLARVFVLEHAAEFRIEQLDRSTALAELAKHVHRLDPEDRAALQREFELLTELVTRVEVARLGYRRDFALLPEVVQRLAVGASESARRRA